MHRDSTCDSLEWDEEVYRQIPLDKVIFGRLRSNPVPEGAFDTIRAVFLKHEVQRTLGLCVVHRHFDLEQSERLVEFNDVSAPWCTDRSPDYLRPGIRAKNWAFLNGGLFPYEFSFSPNAQPGTEPSLPSTAFAAELRDTLRGFGLEDVYGIRALDPDDLDLTTPSKLEFTAGRASVVIPFTKDMESMARVEASWLFPCSNPFTGAFGDGEVPAIKTRICAMQCQYHEGS